MKKLYYLLCLAFSYCCLFGQEKNPFMPGGIIQDLSVLEDAINNYRKNAMPSVIKDSLAFSYFQFRNSKRKLYEIFLEFEPLSKKSFFQIEPENFYTIWISKEVVVDRDTDKLDSALLRRLKEYFPFENKYLIYYDSTKNQWPLLLSGPAKLDYFRYEPNSETARYVNPSSAGLFRMFAYGVDYQKPLKPFRTRPYPPRADDPFVWYNLDSCTLSYKHPAILKVPYSTSPYYQDGFDKMEIIFYTDTIPAPPKPKIEPVVEITKDTVQHDPFHEYPKPLPPPGIEEKDLFEVKFIIYNNPKSKEETLIPRFRKISETEKRNLLDFLISERIYIDRFFIDSKTLYEKMAPYHLLPQK